MDWPAFSLRLDPSEGDRLEATITGVSDAQLEAMRRALAKVYKRFLWSRVACAPLYRPREGFPSPEEDERKQPRLPFIEVALRDSADRRCLITLRTLMVTGRLIRDLSRRRENAAIPATDPDPDAFDTLMEILGMRLAEAKRTGLGGRGGVGGMDEDAGSGSITSRGDNNGKRARGDAAAAPDWGAASPLRLVRRRLRALGGTGGLLRRE